MNRIDFRTTHGIPADEDSFDLRTYVVLLPQKSITFHYGEGNWVPWDHLKPTIERRMPTGLHTSITDISIGPQSDVFIDGRGGEDTVVWMCDKLLERGLVPPSAPVSMLDYDGSVREIGPIEAVGHKLLAFA